MSDATPPVPPVPPAPEPVSPAADAPATPAPKFGEFAPVEAASAAPVAPAVPSAPAVPVVDPALQAAPGQPVTYSGPAQPAAPGYPQAGYPQPGYAQPGYPQPGAYPQHPGYPQTAYPQPVYGQPGFGATAAPKRRTWDVVLTIILLVLGLGGMLLGVLYGVIFSSPELIDESFRQQGFDGFSGDVGVMPVILVVSHLVLYLVAVGLSILLLVKKKVAFWAPLSAGVVAAILFWVLLFMMILSDPNFLSAYGA